MRKETTYVAFDGKEFPTEKACVQYEQSTDEHLESKINFEYEILRAKDEIEYWGGRINQLKASGPKEEYKTEPNKENIDHARTFSQIEQICVNAKNKYNVVINSKAFTSKIQRMHAIALAASMYFKALEVRETIRNNYEKCKAELSHWTKRLTELETWKANGNVKIFETAKENDND